MKGREEALVTDVCAWAQGAGFGRVVVVGGADATLRTDSQLAGYVRGAAALELSSQCRACPASVPKGGGANGGGGGGPMARGIPGGGGM